MKQMKQRARNGTKTEPRCVHLRQTDQLLDILQQKLLTELSGLCCGRRQL